MSGEKEVRAVSEAFDTEMSRSHMVREVHLAGKRPKSEKRLNILWFCGVVRGDSKHNFFCIQELYHNHNQMPEHIQ